MELVSRSLPRLGRRARELFAVLLGLIVFLPRVSTHVHLTLAAHDGVQGHAHGHSHGHSHGKAHGKAHATGHGHAPAPARPDRGGPRRDHAPHPVEDHLEAGPDLVLLEAPDGPPIVGSIEAAAAVFVVPSVRTPRPTAPAEPRPPPRRRGAPPRAPPIVS